MSIAPDKSQSPPQQESSVENQELNQQNYVELKNVFDESSQMIAKGISIEESVNAVLPKIDIESLTPYVREHLASHYNLNIDDKNLVSQALTKRLEEDLDSPVVADVPEEERAASFMDDPKEVKTFLDEEEESVEVVPSAPSNKEYVLSEVPLTDAMKAIENSPSPLRAVPDVVANIDINELKAAYPAMLSTLPDNSPLNINVSKLKTQAERDNHVRTVAEEYFYNDHLKKQSSKQ